MRTVGELILEEIGRAFGFEVSHLHTLPDVETPPEIL